MPTMHIPDKLVTRIIRLGKKMYEDYKQFVREAIVEKLRIEEKDIED